MLLGISAITPIFKIKSGIRKRTVNTVRNSVTSAKLSEHINPKCIGCTLLGVYGASIFRPDSENAGLTELGNLYEGDCSTESKNSIPLQDFEDEFSRKNLTELREIGQSTNTNGFARSFLKTTADRPVSTSAVHDCSVLYLYNDYSKTHFLYHMYSDTTKKEINTIIKTFMPEGFTHAGIVPGDSFWVRVHKNYLPKVFDAVKENNQNAVINLYKYETTGPEIVGYKGKMYAITNKWAPENRQSGGQASFKISDLRYDTTVAHIKDIKDAAFLRYVKCIIDSYKYDDCVKKIMLKCINERLNALNNKK